MYPQFGFGCCVVRQLRLFLITSLSFKTSKLRSSLIVFILVFLCPPSLTTFMTFESQLSTEPVMVALQVDVYLTMSTLHRLSNLERVNLLSIEETTNQHLIDISTHLPNLQHLKVCLICWPRDS